MPNKTYAGIGSRRIPSHQNKLLMAAGEKLDSLGYHLFSGGAPGCDTVFEDTSSSATIFLPWDGFNDRWVRESNDCVEYLVDETVNLNAWEYVVNFHPNPGRLSPGAVKLMSRNTYQVLGPDLKSPVDFVLCWTTDGKDSGGTGQAIRIARSKNIPVYNLNNSKSRTDFESFLNIAEFCSEI